MKVADVMSRPVYSCGPHESLARAAQIMWERDCGVVPVVDGQGRAIAMLTDRDVCMAALTQARCLSELRVSQAMSKLVYTCHPEDRLSAAERTMRVHQVRRLPVVDDAGRLLGLLSINDVCRVRAESAAGSAIGEVVTTLAQIGKPRREPASQAPLPPIQVQPMADTPVSSPRLPPKPIRDPSALFRF